MKQRKIKYPSGWLFLYGVIVGCWFAELVCETSDPKGSRGFNPRMTPL